MKEKVKLVLTSKSYFISNNTNNDRHLIYIYGIDIYKTAYIYKNVYHTYTIILWQFGNSTDIVSKT